MRRRVIIKNLMIKTKKILVNTRNLLKSIRTLFASDVGMKGVPLNFVL